MPSREGIQGKVEKLPWEKYHPKNSLLFKDYFYSNAMFTAKTERKIKRFSIYPLPSGMQTSSITNIPLQNGTFVMIDKPTLTHRDHPKSIVHTWCCTFNGSGQLYNDMYPPF